MKSSLKSLGFLALGAAATLALVFAVRARAAGIPDAEVLTYTGYLEDGEGAPLAGDHSIAVRFWAADTGGNALCSAELATATLVSGRFQVPLPAECTDAVGANPNLFVDVAVDGASLGRTKLGAVPYAIEAGRAVTADSAAAAAGALEQRIAELEAKVEGLVGEDELPAVTGWSSYTPAATGQTGAALANSTTSGSYRRVGDSVEVSLVTRFTGAPNSGSTWYQWSLPPGLSIDDSKLADGGGALGFGSVESGPSNVATLYAWRRSATTVSASANGGSVYYVNDTVPFTVGNGSYFSLHFVVPIQGWDTTP
jgi:hypothetical protein